VGTALCESSCRNVVDFDPVSPLWLGSFEILMHLGEPEEQRIIRRIAKDGDQIDVADVRLEITRGERTVHVETHERRPDGVDDRVANDADDRIGIRVGLRPGWDRPPADRIRPDNHGGIPEPTRQREDRRQPV
jgi:hypothetical protein